MSEQTLQQTESRIVECVIPVLRVNDLAASLRFYGDMLGFTKDWGGDGDSPEIASVSRDGHAIMLCQGANGQPGMWVWIGVEDVAPLYELFQARGVNILQPPTNRPWALEMKISDPDGHVLWFGSEPLADQPFAS